MSNMNARSADMPRPTIKMLVVLGIATVVALILFAGLFLNVAQLATVLLGVTAGLLLTLYIAVKFPAIFVGLLQGGMGIVVAVSLATNVTIPDGVTLVGFSVLSMIGFCAIVVHNPVRLNIFVRPVAQFSFAFAILVVTSVAYSWHDEALTKALLFLFANMVSFMVAAVLDERQRRILYWLFFAVGLVVSIGILASFLGGDRGAIAGRYQGFGLDVISGARMVGLGILVTLYAPLRIRFRFVSLLLLGAGFMLAGTRGPVLALLATVFLAPILAGAPSVISSLSKRSLSLIVSIVAALLVLLFIAANNSEILMTDNWGPLRIINDTNASDGNIIVRFHHLFLAAEEFAEKPILGWGIGGYGGSEPDRDPINYNFPHNLTMETMAELGIVGLILLICFLGFAYGVARNAYHRHSPGYLSKEALFVTAMLTYTLVNAHVSGLFHTNRTVWLAVGLIEAVAFNSRLAVRSARNQANSIAGQGAELL